MITGGKSNVDAIKGLARHFGRSPDELTEEEIRQFFVHPTETQRFLLDQDLTEILETAANH